MYHFTDTIKTKEMFISLRIWCARERERHKDDNGEERSPSLPLCQVAGISIRKPTGVLLWRCFRRAGRSWVGCQAVEPELYWFLRLGMARCSQTLQSYSL